MRFQTRLIDEMAALRAAAQAAGRWPVHPPETERRLSALHEANLWRQEPGPPDYEIGDCSGCWRTSVRFYAPGRCYWCATPPNDEGAPKGADATFTTDAPCSGEDGRGPG